MKKIFSLVAIAALYVACGSNSNNGSSSSNAPVTTPGQCVNTAYGCLPQCPSNPSMGVLNGQCVAAVGTNYNGYQYGYYGNLNNYYNNGYYNTGYTGWNAGYPYYPYYPYNNGCFGKHYGGVGFRAGFHVGF